jgi:hypothetical protein
MTPDSGDQKKDSKAAGAWTHIRDRGRDDLTKPAVIVCPESINGCLSFQIAFHTLNVDVEMGLEYSSDSLHVHLSFSPR